MWKARSRKNIHRANLTSTCLSLLDPLPPTLTASASAATTTTTRTMRKRRTWISAAAASNCCCGSYMRTISQHCKNYSAILATVPHSNHSCSCYMDRIAKSRWTQPVPWYVTVCHGRPPSSLELSCKQLCRGIPTGFPKFEIPRNSEINLDKTGMMGLPLRNVKWPT